MFDSNLFFGTMNPFTGLSSFFSVKTLGSAYAETASDINTVFVLLNKTYVIDSHYNVAVVAKSVAAAYAETAFAA